MSALGWREYVSRSALSGEEQAAVEAILEDHAGKGAQVTAYAQKQARTAAELAAYIRAKCGLPAGSAAPAAAADLAAIEAAAARGTKRALEAKEIPSFSMSSAGSEKNWSVIQQMFRLEPQVWSAEFGTAMRAGISDAELQRLQPPPFNWEVERTESNQKQEYLSYLRQFVTLPRKLALALAPNQLLDLENGSYGFKLSGTSDLVIIDNDVQRTVAGELGDGTAVTAAALVATIELKKKVTERDVRQAAAELISADLHAQTLQPFAVVTDLQDDWRFLWLRGSRTIMVMRVPTVEQSAGDAFAPRRAASLLLRRLLATSTDLVAERQAATALLEALPIPIGKRQKLSPVKERPHGRGEDDACARVFDGSDAESDSDDVDGPGWDEEDRRGVLFRQVRAAMRLTPWMRDVLRRPACFDAPLMGEGARNMFG